MLRLQASIQDAHARAAPRAAARPSGSPARRWRSCCSLARELRPTALDDHGLLPALRAQVRDFADRTGIHADFRRRGDVPPLTDDQQLVIYRVTQESLSNVAQHARRHHVTVELSFVGRTVLRIADDGCGVKGDAQRRARADGDARARAARGRRPRHPLRADGAGTDRHPDDELSRMRILIADDHGIVRSGLRLLLDRQADMEVVAEAEDGARRASSRCASGPTCASSTSACRGSPGLQATREIKSQAPEMSVLILSMHRDERYLFEALKAGASGYVLKAEADQDLVEACARRRAAARRS